MPHPVSRPAPPNDVMRVADMLSRPGVKLESRNDRLTLEHPLFRGSFWNRELRRGLSLHASDVYEDEAFTTTSAQEAGLSCVFFLEGDAEIEIGDRRFVFHGERRLEGVIIPTAQAERFRRFSRGRQRLRHLVISVAPEWLDRDGLPSTGETGLSRTLFSKNLSAKRWQVSTRIEELVLRVMSPTLDGGDLGDLLRESAAVEIVVEALTVATEREIDCRRVTLTKLELTRLSRAEEFILSSQASPLRIEAIARAAGTSTSSLQRLFRAAHEKSVVEHIRDLRLDQARVQLESGMATIKQISAHAGYSSPANFSTAFRRRFGVTPNTIASHKRG